MQYKTIALELIKQCPQMYHQLRKSRLVLPAMEACASQLKASHEAWKEQLAQARPVSDASQISSEALEIAVKELEESLPNESAADESEAFSLEEAMAFIKRHTPLA